MVQDHIYYSLSRLLSLLGDPGTAAGFLSHLLSSGGSRLSPEHQRAILMEFFSAYRAYVARKAAADASTDLLSLSPPSVVYLSKPGLPTVLDDTFQIHAWDNAEVARAAIAALASPPSAAESVPLVGAAAAAGAAFPLASWDSDGSAQPNLGASSGLWGPVAADAETAFGEAKLWKRLEQSVKRDLDIDGKGCVSRGTWAFFGCWLCGVDSVERCVCFVCIVCVCSYGHVRGDAVPACVHVCLLFATSACVVFAMSVTLSCCL